MRGIDISHWNKITDWRKVREAGYEFVFAKCTEGRSFRDKSYLQNQTEARKNGILFGAYHFARGTDAAAEADWFMDNIGNLKPGELVALDYEIWSLKNPAEWCLRWLRRVEDRLGFKPFLYTYHSLLKTYNWTPVSSNGNPLWAARYGLQEQEPNKKFFPETGSWPQELIWQYCSKGRVPGIIGNVDLNSSDIIVSTLAKYGSISKNECTHCCNVHCPQ